MLVCRRPFATLPVWGYYMVIRGVDYSTELVCGFPELSERIPAQYLPFLPVEACEIILDGEPVWQNRYTAEVGTGVGKRGRPGDDTAIFPVRSSNSKTDDSIEE